MPAPPKKADLHRPSERPRFLAQMTEEELREAVRESVADLIDDFPTNDAEGLLDLRGLAKYLGSSLSTVHKLRAEGLPTIYVGDSPRFKLDEVLGWLKSTGKATSKAKGRSVA